MNAIWQMWASALSDKLCDEIITECEYYKPSQANIGNEQSKIDDNVRKSTVRWIDATDPNSKFIHDLLLYYARLANRQAFGFDITQLHDIQYTTYDEEQQGFYKLHHDTFWANTTAFDRKISITIQLSNPNDYEGGEFMFDKQYIQPDQSELKQRGTVLAFPSPIDHYVQTVTKGIRKSLVAWIEGPKWR